MFKYIFETMEAEKRDPGNEVDRKIAAFISRRQRVTKPLLCQEILNIIDRLPFNHTHFLKRKYQCANQMMHRPENPQPLLDPP